MIRIAYLIVDLKIGGSERVVERIATHLDRTEFDPLVVSLTSPGPIGARISREGIPVLALETRGAFEPRAARFLIHELRKRRTDILHAFLFHANLTARFVAPFAGRPAVIATHRTLEGGAKHWAWERLTWRFCDRIVCASQAVRDHARRAAGIPESASRVIYNGVEAATNGTRGRNLVATASRLDPGKGVEDVLEAVKGLAPVRVIGDGTERARLQALAPEAEFTGAVDDVRAALQGASVFVHASQLGEGMPNAVLEAMACGLPVVATDVGGTREAVVHGETGFLVPPGSPSTLRGCVERLLSDRREAREMGERARSRARLKFSLERMVGEYVSLYRELAP